LAIFEVKSTSQTTPRFPKSCYFDRKINGFVPYVLQSCSLPAALSTGFYYHLRTADWLRIPRCYSFTNNRHSTSIHLPKS